MYLFSFFVAETWSFVILVSIMVFNGLGLEINAGYCRIHYAVLLLLLGHNLSLSSKQTLMLNSGQVTLTASWQIAIEEKKGRHDSRRGNSMIGLVFKILHHPELVYRWKLDKFIYFWLWCLLQLLCELWFFKTLFVVVKKTERREKRPSEGICCILLSRQPSLI